MNAHHLRFARVSDLTLGTVGTILAFACLWHCPSAQAQEKPVHILLLHAYDCTPHSTAPITDAIRKRMIERSSQRFEIDPEFLDLARAPEPEDEVRLATFFRERYARKPPAFIMTLGSEAIGFAIRHRSTFAPSTPVVFVAATQESYASLRPPPDMTGMISDLYFDLDNPLKLAEQLHPHARQLFVTAESQADYRAMQRIGLKEGDLPQSATMTFKEPTIWDEHRYFVLAAIGTIALQSLFAGALLLERRSRRRAEALLTESEERMTFTAAAANVGLWQFNPETDELWTTEHCRAMFGLDTSAPLTRASLLTPIHPDDRDAALASLRHISNSDQPASNDVRVVWPDLQIRWIRILARSNRDSRQDPKKLSGTFIDISEQKTAEVEIALQRQEVAHLMRVSVLGELSGAIAHEINQPLTAILANAQAALHLLPENAPNVAEVREALRDIVHEDHRAGQVIQRLKTLLRKGETTYEPIALNDIVNATIALLNSELIGRGVSVQVVLANDLPPTSGDPVQLQQVLINLIINAIDAMAATPATQRSIMVSTRATRHGTTEVVVRDRGTGIASQEGRRIFEPFYTTKTHGLGLGLTICSTIVQAHGGELSLTNNADGGADARFSLPAQKMLVAAQ